MHASSKNEVAQRHRIAGRPDTQSLIAEGQHPLPVKAEWNSSTQVEVTLILADRPDTQRLIAEGQHPLSVKAKWDSSTQVEVAV